MVNSKMNVDFSKLRRNRHPMPNWIENALLERGLMEEYRHRPAYQQNDYLGWISQAKRQETKLKRLNQMLNELEKGGVYMNMDHPSSAK
ncbi:YdeI/OmpD-associated family protein [Dongshaea marina]|uniref:YdeI/OmpD-associated family protein n=1 Tax=Dongshaea marina TaxID=2047966 RepID=UPI003898ED06